MGPIVRVRSRPVAWQGLPVSHQPCRISMPSGHTTSCPRNEKPKEQIQVNYEHSLKLDLASGTGMSAEKINEPGIC